MKTLFKISRLRQQIVSLAVARQAAERVLLSRKEMLKGTVVKALRTCGKVGCKCAKGQKHLCYQVSASVQGKTRTRHLPQEHMGKVKTWTESYRAFRQARAKWVSINSQMLQRINELEAAKTLEDFCGEQRSQNK